MPGRVDQQRAGRKRDELAVRRRVPPAPVLLISAVTSTSRPASRLTSVDLPTPDEPSSAIVRPGARCGFELVDARRRSLR